METLNPPPPVINPSDVTPPPFLPNIAQIQALGLLGYLPPFAPLNFLPPNINAHAPLDLSKSGYESMAQHPQEPFVTAVTQTTASQVTPDEEAMDTEEDAGEQRKALRTVSALLENMDPGFLDESDPDEQRKPIQDRVRQKRQTLQDMTRSLKHWLYHHRDNPYPSKSEKVQLARSSQMTMTQVSNWFANARRRLKNTVRGPELTWAKRIKLYNNCVEGNQELLSVGSSSSDDDQAADLTTGDAEQTRDGDAERVPRVPDVTERVGGGNPLAEISDTSALADRGQSTDEDNLRARLQDSSHSVPEPQAFDLHRPSPAFNFSAIHPGSCQNVNIMLPTGQLDCKQMLPVGPLDCKQILPVGPMDSTQMLPVGQLDCKQTTQMSPIAPHATQNADLPAAHALAHMNSAISGFGDGDAIVDGGDAPPKYKHTIMQRYLTDSYNSYQNALLSLNSPVNKDPKEKERHRNPSGSLSSHDYEEYMSSASSARSTPTREHQDHGHVDEYEEFSRHWPDIKTRAEDDLYWKEISAALALTSLARSRYPAPPQ